MQSLILYKPNRLDDKSIKAQKELFKTFLNTDKQQQPKKEMRLFILNDFLVNVFDTQTMLAVLQKIYGIGATRAALLSYQVTYNTQPMVLRQLTTTHFQKVADLLESKNLMLKNQLQLIKKTNISLYKFVNCNRGLRHLRYLPVRGQRTHSNAHVARYLGSGTFEFVPTKPSQKLKKLSKYSRRKGYLVDASQSRYQRLLTKNYVEFQKNNKHLFKHLVKKNKLGVFGKIFKEKAKVAKNKAKLLKKASGKKA